ncbi:peptidoglycan-binding protein [Streptomyces sp. NPDC004111]|uniref:peptidoglycan-binding protein n=1 Tax=Streptomyces sp. NPDC004111 TaxID=3364690 RepID=UPI0036962EF9
MSSHARRINLAASAVAMVTAAVLALSTTPASASGTYSGLAYIAGAGTYTDDWGDEGITDTTHNINSNATCVWQQILWADGYLPSIAQIDGVFGTATATATANWQRHFMGAASADGSAGKNTWGNADNRLYYISGSETSGLLVVAYNGRSHDFTLGRGEDGKYRFGDGTGNWWYAGYNYRTCSF